MPKLEFFKPGHVLALRFKEGVVFLRILEAEYQEYILPSDGSRLTITANNSSNPYSYTPTITSAGLTKNLFEVDTDHKDEIVHFFFGIEPYDLMLRIRWGLDGPRRYPNMYVPAIGSALFEFIQSDFYNPNPKTELFGHHQGATPYIYIVNTDDYNKYARFRFIGRRYKYVGIPPDVALTLEEVRQKRFALRNIGSIDTLISVKNPRFVFGVDYVNYDELIEVLRRG